MVGVRQVQTSDGRRKGQRVAQSLTLLGELCEGHRESAQPHPGSRRA